ncbi:MAG: hypothetical protein ABEH59_09770 [Halobacteriales archaeon]
MSIARGIAEAHDWEIIGTAESSGGARFEFTAMGGGQVSNGSYLEHWQHSIARTQQTIEAFTPP